MIGIANSMFDLGMSVQMIQDNISSIYNWKRTYTPVEIYDYLVNGVELPERQQSRYGEYKESKTFTNTVANFQPTPNPHPQCCYTRDGDTSKVNVRSRCIYCNSVKMYAPQVCPSYNLKTVDSNQEEENNILDSNQTENEHSE